MKPNTEQPKAPESKPGSKPNPQDDLKSLPLTEICHWKWGATNAGEPA